MKHHGLTKREKIMLFLVAVLLICFAAFHFALIPFYNAYTDALGETDALTNQKMLLDAKLASETQTRAGYQSALAAYNTIKSAYPSVMPNEEVDRIFTGICLENKLEPVMLGINSPSSSDPDAAFSTVIVNMGLRGELENLNILIDTILDIQYIRVSRVSYSDTRLTGGSNISISFEMIMMKEDA